MTGLSIGIKCKQKQELEELSSCVSPCVWFIKANKSLSIDVYSRFNNFLFCRYLRSETFMQQLHSHIGSSQYSSSQVFFFRHMFFPHGKSPENPEKLAWRNVSFISSALEFLWDRHWISEDPSGQKATLSSQKKTSWNCRNGAHSQLDDILCLTMAHITGTHGLLAQFALLLSHVKRILEGYETFNQKEIASWWLNQPIWKICSSNWKSSPKFRGENNKHLSCHRLGLALNVLKYLLLHLSHGKRKTFPLYWLFSRDPYNDFL